MPSIERPGSLIELRDLQRNVRAPMPHGFRLGFTQQQCPDAHTLMSAYDEELINLRSDASVLQAEDVHHDQVSNRLLRLDGQPDRA